MEELISVDTIIDWIKEQIAHKREVPPSVLMDAVTKLTVLMGDETDKLYEFQQKVAHLKVLYIEQDQSATEAKIRVEASDIYKLMMQQKSKIDRIIEFIRIMKVRAKLKIGEANSY